MEFLVLGPVEVRESGIPVRLRGMRRRRLLALLALNAPRAVTMDTLIDELWPDPPASARHQVHNAVRDLRAALATRERGDLITMDAGYRLDVPPDAVDAHLFTQWVRTARAARREGRDAEAIRLLQSAVDLWRGDAFAGIDCPAVTAAAAGLDEQRLTALEELTELRLAAGETGSLVGELSTLVAGHPLRDTLRGNLMLALHRSGRQADALAVYEEGRRLLANDLGLTPSPHLRHLHTTILKEPPQTQTTPHPTPGPATPGSATSAPASPGLATSGPASLGLATSGPATPGLASLGLATSGPATPGPATPGPATPGPATPGPGPGTADPNITGPGTLGLGLTDLGSTWPAATGPGTNRLGATEPGATHPAVTGPCIAGLGSTGSGAPGPGVTHPATTGLDAPGPGVTHPAPTSGTTGPGPTHPATTPRTGPANHLPRDLPDFTGRDAELAWLQRAADGQPHGAPLTVAIDGMGGIGKTALAVHFAHRRTADHPDGQYYIDLHGFSPDHAPLTPEEALGVLLSADGTAPEALPTGLAARSTLWRSRLAGRRALLLLDNAADAAQVAPLLPGTGGTLTLITTRRKPTAPDGARSLPLGALTPADAETLFHRVAGDASTGAPLTRTVALCDHHPLAVRIAATRLRDRPSWTVPDVTARLRTTADRTAFLRTADRDLTSVLALSYTRLPADTREATRTLALHPAATHDIPQACAATGLTPAAVEHLFDTLLDHNLAHEPSPARLTIPALLRDCAHTLAPPAHDTTRRLTVVA